MNIEYEIIGNTIPFDKSAEMYSRSTHIGNADDGWSEIVKIGKESQRYCNYSKDKFNNEITFIMPSWWNYNSSIIESGERYFCEILQKCEDYYKSLLDMGYKPQEARVVLPNATKTELVMTGFESNWENFFELRCSKAAHPDAQKLANELKELLINVKKY